MFWLMAILILATPLPVSAQEDYLGQFQVPQPISELFDTFGRIKIDFPGIPIINKAIQSFSHAAQNPERVTSDLTGIFEKINIWFQNNVGVSLKEITSSLGNFIVWVLELIVRLIKAGLSVVT